MRGVIRKSNETWATCRLGKLAADTAHATEPSKPPGLLARHVQEKQKENVEARIGARQPNKEG